MQTLCKLKGILQHSIFVLLMIEMLLHYVTGKDSVTFKLQDSTRYKHRVGNIAEEAYGASVTYTNVILTPEKYFSADRSSNLITKMVLDRDIICVDLGCCMLSQCTIEIEAHLFRDALPVNVKVKVLIQDANDNQPQFKSSKIIRIPESSPPGTSFPLPKATDKDSPNFGVVKYQIMNPNNVETFTLVQENKIPILRINNPLDRETKDQYEFTLYAIDGGNPPLTGSTTVQIEISDDNDHAPQFVGNSSAIITIPEDTAKGTKLITMKAVDNDIGDNSVIRYSLQSESEPITLALKKFKIDPNKGDVILKEMVDYEEKIERKFTLYIIAQDGGSPPSSSTATLTVFIQDVNDNEPTLNIGISHDVEENDHRKDRLIKAISVEDSDETMKQNISCRLKESGDFTLTEYSSKLYVLKQERAFDYEKEQEVHPVIECLDPNPPANTIRKVLSVKIIDKNDNWPQFEKNTYRIRVPEDTPPNTELITITATDKDSGDFGKVTYNLTAIKDAAFMQYITISQTGRVILLKKLDRERLPRISFKVQATDGGKPRGLYNITELVLEVSDINDNAPRYEGSRRFSVVENPPQNEEIGILPFSDPDAGLNSTVDITLDRNGSPADNWFYITQDKLFARNTVDRESYPNVTLRIVARDRGSPPQSTTVLITVLVEDRNDNSPRLIYPHNNTLFGNVVPVPINSPRGSVITSLRVRDADAGENGTITYRILQTNASRAIFSIGRVDGRLVTDWFEMDQPKINVYSLAIEMSDNGIPRRSIVANFFVNITSAVYMASGSDQSLSNVVILILIVVCSMALIISLIAAIFWVRFRVTRPSRSPPGYAASSQFSKSYCEGTPVHFYQPGEMQPDYLMDYTNSCTIPRKDPRLQTISRRDDYYQMENIGQATYCPKEMPLSRQAGSLQCVQCVTSASPADSIASPSSYTTSTLPATSMPPVSGPPTAPRTGIAATLPYHHPHPVLHFHGNGGGLAAPGGAGAGGSSSRSGPKNERRLSDLSYSDSGKGGSLEDLSRFPTATSTFANPNNVNNSAGGANGASAAAVANQNGAALGSKLERIRGLQAANAAAAAAKSTSLKKIMEPMMDEKAVTNSGQNNINNICSPNSTPKCYKNQRANTPETMC